MFFLLLFQSERRSAGSTATVFRQFSGFISFYVNARKSIDTQVEVEKEYTFRSLLECSFLRKIKYFLIAALISAGYYSAPIFYNSKNLNCIGALCFF